MSNIIVYSTPTCHFCHMAKDFFKEKNISFEEIDVSVDLEKKKEVMQKSGRLGVPVIQIGDQYLPGFNKQKVCEVLGIAE